MGVGAPVMAALRCSALSGFHWKHCSLSAKLMAGRIWIRTTVCTGPGRRGCGRMGLRKLLIMSLSPLIAISRWLGTADMIGLRSSSQRAAETSRSLRLLTTRTSNYHRWAVNISNCVLRHSVTRRRHQALVT